MKGDSMANTEGGFGFDCPSCGVRMDILGFDVDEDLSMTFFSICSEECEGDESVLPVYFPHESLETMANRKKEELEFAEFLEASGLADPGMERGD